jgi:hypothetical protein
MKLYFWWTVAIVAILAIYGGVPVAVWTFLHPTIFWEKLALIVLTFVYEGAAVAWGIVFGIGLLVSLVD